jgi:hypothetical protein
MPLPVAFSGKSQSCHPHQALPLVLTGQYRLPALGTNSLDIYRLDLASPDIVAAAKAQLPQLDTHVQNMKYLQEGDTMLIAKHEDIICAQATTTKVEQPKHCKNGSYHLLDLAVAKMFQAKQKASVSSPSRPHYIGSAMMLSILKFVLGQKQKSVTPPSLYWQSLDQSQGFYSQLFGRFKGLSRRVTEDYDHAIPGKRLVAAVGHIERYLKRRQVLTLPLKLKRSS